MIVIDVETTGLNHEKNAILSIGALDFKNPFYQFYQECRIWPGAEISDIALGINGFTREQITDPNRPSQREALEKFLEWLEFITDLTIAGENPTFDKEFLNTSLKREGLKFRFGRRTRDLHTTCCNSMDQNNYPIPLKDKSSDQNTDKILQYCGLSQRNGYHNALEDVRLEAEAFSRLIHGRILLKEFEKYSIPSYLKKK